MIFKKFGVPRVGIILDWNEEECIRLKDDRSNVYNDTKSGHNWTSIKCVSTLA